MSMNSNGTELEQVVQSQSSLLNIYFLLSGFQSLLLLMHFRYCPNTCSRYTQAWHRTSERSHMWRTTFVIGTSQLLSETEIAPKSPFLCVNRSPSVQYGFPAGARAIRDSMNIALSLTREKCYHIWNGYLYFLNWFSITNQEQEFPLTNCLHQVN